MGPHNMFADETPETSTDSYGFADPEEVLVPSKLNALDLWFAQVWRDIQKLALREHTLCPAGCSHSDNWKVP